jgi:hypothetical protein
VGNLTAVGEAIRFLHADVLRVGEAWLAKNELLAGLASVRVIHVAKALN